MGRYHNLNPEVLNSPNEELAKPLLEVGVEVLIRLVHQEDGSRSPLERPQAGLEHYVKADCKVLGLPTAEALHALNRFAGRYPCHLEGWLFTLNGQLEVG